MSLPSVVRELQHDLARKHRLHFDKSSTAWRSFDQDKRAQVLRAGCMDGVILQHAEDRSLGNVCLVMPEWNLRNLTPEPNFLLDILHFRATTPLLEQYMIGVAGAAGDHDLIIDMVANKGLRYARSFRNKYTLFASDDRYGESYEFKHEVAMHFFAPLIEEGSCVPLATGDLILTRQEYLLQALNIVVEDILEEGSTTREQKARPKKNADPATSLSKMSLSVSTAETTLSDLASTAEDHMNAYEDSLALIRGEPVVLAHLVNLWHLSRPELVPDEMGRQLPAHTDKYISFAVVDVVQDAVSAAAIWRYIHGLLEISESLASGRPSRATLLQELGNVCSMEFTRAQRNFKRQVSIGLGSKSFKRLSNASDNGVPRVVLKSSPDDEGGDRQLQYLLRLCHSETTPTAATKCLTKLDDLHRNQPLEREKLTEHEFEALGDLAVIVSFMKSLSTIVPLPVVSRKQGQIFTSKTTQLDTKLASIKTKVDLSDFVVPIDNLLEPGMATGALTRLDEVISQKLGSKIGVVYEGLVKEALIIVETTLRQKSAGGATQKSKPGADSEYIPLPHGDDPSDKQSIHSTQCKEKPKTRPSDTPSLSITSLQHPTPPSSSPKTPAPPQPIKVKPETAATFTSLFSKTGSIPWDAFTAAMANVGFSVVPKFGSVVAFLPPEGLGGKSLHLHRPHKARIENWLLSVYAFRLKRRYGWSEKSFLAV